MSDFMICSCSSGEAYEWVRCTGLLTTFDAAHPVATSRCSLPLTHRGLIGVQVEILEPESKKKMYANVISGDCLWDPPAGVPV